LAQTYAAPSINLREQFQGTAIERQIAQRVLALYPYQAPQTISEAARMPQMPRGQLESYLARGEFQQPRGARFEYVTGLPGLEVPSEQIRSILADIYRESQKQLEAEKASTAAAQEIARIRQQFLQDLQSNPPLGVGDEVLARPYTPRPEQRLPTFEEVQQGVRGYLAQPDYSLRSLQQRFGEGLGSAADALQNFVSKANSTVASLADPSGLRAAAASYVDPVADRARMVTQLPGAERRRAFFEEQRQRRTAEDEAEKAKLEASQRIAQNFERAADYAGQVGGSLGSAFADVLMKTTTLRQAFASIVASFARQGLADIGTAIFRGAVNGLTPTQAQGNVGMRTPGGP
jgi:hypothetical protein